MSLSSLSVRRGVTFSMIFAAVLGFGLFSLNRLQLDLYPELSFPVVMVLTNYTGAGPMDIENLVSEPIESAVSAAKGVKSVTSESKLGVSMVVAEFGWDMDMDQAETDIRRRLEMIQGFLPDDADKPLVFAMDPSMQPIVMLTVEADYPQDELKRIAEDEICDKLERLSGVAACDVLGGLDREIRVVLDPQRLSAYGMDATTVIGAIARENMQEPGGIIEQGPFAFDIHTKTQLQSLYEIENVVIGMRVNSRGVPTPIRVKHVAQVSDTFNEMTRSIEVDGNPSVWIIVRKQTGENTVRSAAGVLQATKDYEEESEGRIRFGTIFNQADYINDSLGNLSFTALIAVGISFMVLLFFLGNIKSALIVAVAIPLSVIATFFVMDQANMTLNVLSMAGLALAVGLLVDNAIVVLENIFRLRQEGSSIKKAAEKGAGEVSTAVMASTLTTVSVFIPVLFVPGIAGVMFKDMAITICFALLCSLLVAVSFIPLAASRLLGSKKNENSSSKGSGWNPVGKIVKPYGRLLEWVLKHRYVVPLGLLGAIVITGLIALTLPTEFMMEQDQSMISLTLEGPVGSNLEQTRAMTQEAIEAIKEVVPEKDRRLIASEAGTGEGFSAIFSKGAHSATLRIPLSPLSKRNVSQAQYQDRIRERLSEIPDLKVAADIMSPTGGADMEIKLISDDLDKLRLVGLEIEKKLQGVSQLSEVTFSFGDPTPRLQVTFDTDKATELGISTSTMGQVLATYFLGRTAGFYREKGDEHPIVVRYDKANRMDVEQLSRAPIATGSGTSVPLEHLAKIVLEPGPVNVSRLDQSRTATISVILKDSWVDENNKNHRKDLGSTIAVVDGILKDYNWPEDMTYSVGGTAEDFLESFSYLGLALIISIALVYMVMAGLFESFRQPFIILFTVPLALIGVILMFLLTGSPLDVSALIGVIMLVGIVVNNGIVMVDAANQQRILGLDKFKAILSAAKTRLRPVLLTSLTTICSMIPLALEIGDGSEAWSGMARAVIGGLLSATLLTLVVVPTFYTFFARKKVSS